MMTHLTGRILLSGSEEWDNSLMVIIAIIYKANGHPCSPKYPYTVNSHNPPKGSQGLDKDICDSWVMWAWGATCEQARVKSVGRKSKEALEEAHRLASSAPACWIMNKPLISCDWGWERVLPFGPEWSLNTRALFMAQVLLLKWLDIGSQVWKYCSLLWQ